LEINAPKYFFYFNRKSFFIFVLLLVFSYSTPLFAVNTELEVIKTEALSNGTFEYYKSDNITNQIPYFDNRFRIDSELDEITLIFYRKRGSTPVILVRPDGSKIIVNSFDAEKVQWYDDSTFDMIKIKKPMVGPWQAIGDILPESQILVVSDIKIQAEPLPKIIFSGETLKVTGKLLNGELAIDSPNFREVIKLHVNFYSTNNSAYENFGADAIKVASFRDDGRDLDEYANDKVFTGEFFMNFSPGEWEPVYLVKLPMATRELRQEFMMLHKAPITISVDKAQSPDSPHKIIFTIDPSLVDVDSLDFQGKITFPDRELEPFTNKEGTGITRVEEIKNTASGIYRINVNAFGKTINGRDFRLVVPEFSFNIEDEKVLVDTTVLLDGSEQVIKKEINSEDALLALEQERLAVVAAQKLEQEEKETETLLIIAAGNALIIIIALVIFLIMRKRKEKKLKSI
jgi:uncharacterized protein (TIGR03503 family)